MRIRIVLATLAALAAVAGGAQADGRGRPCSDRPEGERLPIRTFEVKVAEPSNEIRSGEIVKACGEFDALDRSGMRDALFVDPTAGAKILAATIVAFDPTRDGGRGQGTN